MKKIVIAEHESGFYCACFIDQRLIAEIDLKTHESMFAWFRLMVGAYPGMYLNDEAA